jgi:hypothetical protein
MLSHLHRSFILILPSNLRIYFSSGTFFSVFTPKYFYALITFPTRPIYPPYLFFPYLVIHVGISEKYRFYYIILFSRLGPQFVLSDGSKTSPVYAISLEKIQIFIFLNMRQEFWRFRLLKWQGFSDFSLLSILPWIQILSVTVVFKYMWPSPNF